jgi:hypothetical protein
MNREHDDPVSDAVVRLEAWLIAHNRDRLLAADVRLVLDALVAADDVRLALLQLEQTHARCTTLRPQEGDS